MYQGREVVALTFAGRGRFMEVLAAYLERSRGLIDRWLLCWNVREPSDKAFVLDLHRRLAPWTQIVGQGGPASGDFGRFYEYAKNPATVYLKLDDDIVWVAPDAVERLLAFRLDHPQYATVSGNIVDNVLMTHLHQRMGLLGWQKIAGWNPVDPVGHADGVWAEHVHRTFLNDLSAGREGEWKFGPFHPYPGERYSINAISFLGEDMARVRVPPDDEPFLTTTLNGILGKRAAWCGDALFAHFAFGPQAAHVDRTDLLPRYRRLAGL